MRSPTFADEFSASSSSTCGTLPAPVHMRGVGGGVATVSEFVRYTRFVLEAR